MKPAMIHRFKASLSLLAWLLVLASTSTLAFNVDTALTPTPGISTQDNLGNPVSATGITPGTAGLSAASKQITKVQHSQHITLQQNTPASLYLMFNLPAAEQGQLSTDSPSSRPFYFDIYGANLANENSNSNSGIFTGWVECEVCRSIFDIEYEKFFNCDKQLFFGWC